MVTCPVCGWLMRKGDIRRGGFACPGCKERLRWPEISGYEHAALVVGGFLLAFLIPYWMGAQGNNLLWYAIALILPISLALGAALGVLRAFLFPAKLERDPTPDGGRILDITGPPDSSNKP